MLETNVPVPGPNLSSQIHLNQCKPMATGLTPDDHTQMTNQSQVKDSYGLDTQSSKRLTHHPAPLAALHPHTQYTHARTHTHANTSEHTSCSDGEGRQKSSRFQAN